MPTYQLIGSTTLTSTQTIISFTSIPATYTDLVLRISARTNAGSTNDSIEITFNGDTSSNYSTRVFYGTGNGGVGADQYTSNVPSRAWYGATGNTATASTFGSTEVYIPNYLASQNKQIRIFGLAETNATAALMASVASLWRNTAAITSITLDPLDGAATFQIGSSFKLYGISNS
jgi:hypothetical protein